MKRLLIYFSIFLAPFLLSQEKPWQVKGTFTYTDQKPIRCELKCTMALIKKALDKDKRLGDFYVPSMSEDIKQWILHAPGKFLEVLGKGRPLPVFISGISIAPKNANDEKENKEKFDPAEVDVKINFLFSTPEVIEKVDIDWKIFPDPLLKDYVIEGFDAASDEYGVPVVLNGHKTFNATLTSKLPSLTWGLKAEKIIPVVPNKDIESKKKYSQLTISLVGFGVSIFATFLFWLIIDHPKLRLLIMVLTFIAGNMVPVFKDFRGVEVKETYTLPEKTDLEKMMTRSLRNIYRGISADSSHLVFEELNKATTGIFRDTTFAKIHKCRVEHPETQQIVEDLKLESIKVLDERQVECQWVISAYIMHLHHIHSKDLRFKAIFKLTPVENQWLIEAGEVIPVYTEDKT